MIKQPIIQRLRALMSNTFVTDCPHCHGHFYGFHAYETNIKINKRPYRIVCHKCAKLKDK